MRNVVIGLVALVGLAGSARGADTPPGDRRMVLVELFTSQGCDMCPTAEEILGKLAATSDRIVPIAFHVDYFNDPWHDPFSEAIFSQRQLAYNALYKKPKNAQYGIYYTPMLMIDGVESVNGRDQPTASATIRAAADRKPQVSIAPTLTLKNDGRSGELRLKVATKSAEVDGREVLIAAVLREDRVVTRVESGENAGKTLNARFPARRALYVTKALDKGKDGLTVTFPFDVEPGWNPANLRLAAFVQDTKTGRIHQATDIPWIAPRSTK